MARQRVGVEEGSLVRTRQCRVLTHYWQEDSVSLPFLYRVVAHIQHYQRIIQLSVEPHQRNTFCCYRVMWSSRPSLIVRP
ncbi:hypothetical protein K439DRAFT_707314 [Ramaria rubella]|nr:hypothetical protein K439DRAFT_707314 [Ramaria rubella]